MIREQVLKVMQKEGYPGGIRVVISVPEGEETAKRTFNPRLALSEEFRFSVPAGL